jgi:uncharacterized cupin superfamily protein
MIVRKREAPADPEAEERAEHYGASERLRYSDAGGLTQLGTHVETLQPGSRSSESHWHEDEFLYVISGEAPVIKEDGAHPLGPGDAACWPAGAANAYQVVNRSGAPCTYLIFGTRVAHEAIHYPDVGRVGYIEGGAWRLHRKDDGGLIMEGETEQARPLAWWGSKADWMP